MLRHEEYILILRNLSGNTKLISYWEPFKILDENFKKLERRENGRIMLLLTPTHRRTLVMEFWKISKIRHSIKKDSKYHSIVVLGFSKAVRISLFAEIHENHCFSCISFMFLIEKRPKLLQPRCFQNFQNVKICIYDLHTT